MPRNRNRQRTNHNCPRSNCAGDLEAWESREIVV